LAPDATTRLRKFAKDVRVSDSDFAGQLGVPCSLSMDTHVLRKCDIVMQGGVTSGVVYPGLVCKLAERYTFQSIGGTSAGAIAASLTAAAEYARRKGQQNAFSGVAEVSTWLGQNSEFASGSNLFALFQPQTWTRDLFRLATAFLVKGFWRIAFALIWLFVIEIIVGVIPAVILYHFSSAPRGWQCWLVLALTILVAIAGIAITAVLGVAIRLCFLPKYHFGLCTGSAPPHAKKAPALVNWLHGKINGIAGKPISEPLTFGVLQKEGITLKMMTTCLTWGRPYTLPFTTNIFYFCPKEFRKFFPEEVVGWLEAHPPKTPPQHHGHVDTGDLRPLPDWDDLPVIVAARFSLSFPLLFCAVPLYAIDWTLRQCKQGEPMPKPVPGGAIGYGQPHKPERVWFSDGGICNNFPLHLFDGPVPRWPTFGVDLNNLRPDRLPNESRVWMPTSNGGGINPEWTRLAAKVGFGGTFGLVAAIIDAARNWVNSLQAIAPGYRDRIVHIALSKTEGGLNLTMPSKVLSSLNEYGVEAAERLIDHFINGTDQDKPTEMTWNNQRWIRYRSTMALLETFLAKFAYTINNPEPGDQSYTALIRNNPSYHLDPAQTLAAEMETQSLVDLEPQMSLGILDNGSPRPEPTLVIRPSF
jgi:predicted acylesterase/phospholipase RssA